MDKTFNITCIRNWSKPPKYNTHFKWGDKEIVLDYHYDDDYLKIFVNGENWIDGDNENLDLLINSLSNGMVHLEYENSKVGEELVISEDSGPEWIE